MKSNSAGPDLVADVALQGGDGRLGARDQVGDDGRVGLDRVGAAADRRRRGGSSSGSGGMKSPRSRTVCSASPISGSHRPMTSRSAARLAGDARRRVTSTNSLPPASCIGPAGGQLPHGEPQRLHGVRHHLLVTDRDVDVVLPVVDRRGWGTAW